MAISPLATDGSFLDHLDTGSSDSPVIHADPAHRTGTSDWTTFALRLDAGHRACEPKRGVAGRGEELAQNGKQSLIALAMSWLCFKICSF